MEITWLDYQKVMCIFCIIVQRRADMKMNAPYILIHLESNLWKKTNDIFAVFPLRLEWSIPRVWIP